VVEVFVSLWGDWVIGDANSLRPRQNENAVKTTLGKPHNAPPPQVVGLSMRLGNPGCLVALKRLDNSLNRVPDHFLAEREKGDGVTRQLR
jgi:hypothetical protein